MAADKYTSILSMRLQMEQQQQQQERAEALQREQMNDQMEMKSLDMMVKTGQNYFAAMKAADDRDLKLAEAKYKQDLAYQKEEREDKAARAKAGAELLKAQTKRQHDIDMQQDRQDWEKEEKIPARQRVAETLRKVVTPREARETIKSDIAVGKEYFTTQYAPLKERMTILNKGKKGGKKIKLSNDAAAAQRLEILEMKGVIGGFQTRLHDPKAKKGGIESNRTHIAKVIKEWNEWLKTPQGQRFLSYTGTAGQGAAGTSVDFPTVGGGGGADMQVVMDRLMTEEVVE
jgi:hypothetical protein